MSDDETLIEELLAGKHRALARVITKIEDRSPGYRDLVSSLHAHTGNAEVIGITGSPGAGKSTLVDKMAATYRERGETVGVIAIDPSSPFTGGAVLGDRIRMASNVGDMDVFFRSMSARGSLGGLSTATTDAVKALDAFGKDKIIVETVGAGQNEIEVVKTADTVAVLVPPGSGDDVQMLKAGILEIADVFVVNKADLDGADRTVMELREMVEMRDNSPMAGHHGADTIDIGGGTDDPDGDADGWEPPIVETVAKSGDGVEEFLGVLADHVEWLKETGERQTQVEKRYAAEIRTLLREDTATLLEAEIEARGGLDQYVQQVLQRETDPYTVADDIVEPLADCVRKRREHEDDYT
ncbi:YgfD family GTPase [Natronomonas pharaonis DSM 2160]|uniref:YgfD family GTPase n=1 Tax=Natronomonas pharaonis (strain ATCC 35678 / DSM 2160 / CIP 103997 / JCM 8858 / NBRC 14720 / NCIMB 2260 / Gabara) TaxID=348780 RepID=A0A1U7EWI5_NATPD|nr:methylmalonyl Co-A mutase-associated GTPase MeaB [Natronomonas pharaonis]CAI49447.1 YgfD family GTPase [Natronomonas pharaonis DSM 2160]